MDGTLGPAFCPKPSPPDGRAMGGVVVGVVDGAGMGGGVVLPNPPTAEGVAGNFGGKNGGGVKEVA